MVLHIILQTEPLPLLSAKVLPHIYSINYLKHPPKSPFKTHISQKKKKKVNGQIA